MRFELVFLVALASPAAADEIADAKKRWAESPHGPLDPTRYPEVTDPSGEAFGLACSQCHVLPDPKRHTAEEWRIVVARMQENMQWMNRVVASQPAPGEPQLRVEEINAFLEKYARRP